MPELPFYLTTRVQQAVASAQTLARAKGLEAAFEMDLFGLDRRQAGVHEVGDVRAAQAFLQDVNELIRRLEAAPDRGNAFPEPSAPKRRSDF